MKHSSPSLNNLLLAASIAIAAPAAYACSSCGCTLSSDWDSQGYAASPGIRVDLRYDYLNQSELRSGTRKVDRSAIVLPSDREIEQGTRNQYTTFGLDYSPSKSWGINVQLPYILRTHTTIAAGDTDPSSSKTASVGDMKILGRYQGFSAEQNIGIQFGLKLPTGTFHDNFRSGPQAGTALDRGLQAGNGTTDLLLGLYHFGALSQNWDYFGQANAQYALAEREGYKPGAALNLNAGLRYVANDTFIPQLQFNAKTGRRDSGANADAENSGGTVVYFSPGLTVSLSPKLKGYGFLQLPVYQNANGYQLAPRYTVSVGMRYSM